MSYTLNESIKEVAAKFGARVEIAQERDGSYTVPYNLKKGSFVSEGAGLFREDFSFNKLGDALRSLNSRFAVLDSVHKSKAFPEAELKNEKETIEYLLEDLINYGYTEDDFVTYKKQGTSHTYKVYKTRFLDKGRAAVVRVLGPSRLSSTVQYIDLSEATLKERNSEIHTLLEEVGLTLEDVKALAPQASCAV